MSEAQTEAAPEVIQDDPQAAINRLREENSRLKNSVSALETKRTEALDETKKLKRIRGILGSVGIDHESEDAETLLAEKLLQAPQKPQTAPVDGADDGGTAAKPGPDPLVEAEMARMRKQLEALQKANQIAEEEKAAAIAKNRADRIERQVVEALQKAGAQNPTHAYRLMALDPSGKYKVDLNEEGLVFGGQDYDPRPLTDVVAAFRDDDNFQYMFAGTGVSGAGSGSRANAASSGGSAVNPFRVDQLNITEAARILQGNPEKAKRLMSEARSVGKLDPKLASIAI